MYDKITHGGLCRLVQQLIQKKREGVELKGMPRYCVPPIDSETYIHVCTCMYCLTSCLILPTMIPDRGKKACPQGKLLHVASGPALLDIGLLIMRLGLI